MRGLSKSGPGRSNEDQRLSPISFALDSLLDMHLHNRGTITIGFALVATLVSACYLSSLPASRGAAGSDRGGLPRKTQALPCKACQSFDHGSVKVDYLMLNNYSMLHFKFKISFLLQKSFARTNTRRDFR